MRLFAGLVLVSVAAVAQERAPVGIVRGDLTAWDGSNAGGSLTVRTADGHVYACTFDSKTYFEREKQRISVVTLRAGDKIEMISDNRQDPKCYAMMVHTVEPHAPVVVQRTPRTRTMTTDTIVPRGNMTLAGVVVRVNPETLTLQTRNDGRKTIVLRADTRYVAAGERVTQSTLPVNTRVFIRAGKNFEDEIEAYQVMWGEILLVR